MSNRKEREDRNRLVPMSFFEVKNFNGTLSGGQKTLINVKEIQTLSHSDPPNDWMWLNSQGNDSVFFTVTMKNGNKCNISALSGKELRRQLK